MMKYQFSGPTNDSVDVELIEDKDHGPVLWVQSGFDGCYVPVDRLDEFIAGLKSADEPAEATA